MQLMKSCKEKKKQQKKTKKKDPKNTHTQEQPSTYIKRKQVKLLQ